MPTVAQQIASQKRAKWDLVQKTRQVFEKADKEARAMTTEERSEVDKMSGTIDEHDNRIGAMEKLVNAGVDDPEPEPASSDPAAPRSAHAGSAEPRAGEARAGRHGTPEYRRAFNRFLSTGQPGETRDVTVGVLGSGGYVVAPIQLSEDIIRQCDNLVFIRNLARIYKLDNAAAIGVRQMTSRVDDADWTSEIGPVTKDAGLGFNRRDLNPNALTKLVLVSDKMIKTGTDVEPTVKEELGYKYGVSQEKGFLTGSGTGMPLGIFTPSASGIPTAQDVTTGTVAGFTADDFIAVKYSLKQPYLRDKAARWVASRPLVAKARALKDNYGAYIWRPGFAQGAPDTILDIGLEISEYCPTVMASGSYIAALGNFAYYGIAQLKDMEIKRLVEKYSDTNEVGFQGVWYVDGSPLLGEAFARMKTQ